MRTPLALAGAAAFAVVATGLVALASATVAAAPEAAQAGMTQMDVAVTMQDYSISPRHVVATVGQPLRFVVTNTGAERHRFNVRGFGERWRAEQDQPGEIAVVEAAFSKPGVYQVYCSSVTEVRHTEAGMVGTLTVVEEGQDAALPVPVALGDYWFQPVGQVTVAGQSTRFSLTNVGELPHSFTVAGHGEEWRSPTVRPGAPVSWDLTIDRPGIYEVLCWFTIPEPHKDLGMVGVLEVLPAGAATMMPGP